MTDLPLWGQLLTFITAFGLGTAHALEPGHGKTLVAAYMTGTRGRIQDAFILGGLVTVFHTLSVFILAMAGVFLADQFIQHNANWLRTLETFSGVIVLVIAGMMFWRRFVQDKTPDECECHFHHVHHDGHAEVSKPAGSIKEVLSLGIASGITPCPAAVVAMITAISVYGFGKLSASLLYLLIFSLGLATVLVGIGVALVLSKGQLSKVLTTRASRLPVLMSQFSTVLMFGIGLYLTLHPWISGPLETMSVKNPSQEALILFQLETPSNTAKQMQQTPKEQPE